ncbi:MAG: TetR family transcriptional regulator [bacterium]|nr:TetR family transcriptional regulator [bacterium]
MPRLSRAAAAALTAEDMVDAAMTVLITEGLDNVNMRRVAAELGVSPIPLYNRIGNKDALLDAMAARIGSEFFLPAGADEHWTDYARRWCHRLRERLLAVPDHQLFLRAGRKYLVAAAEPLIEKIRTVGYDRPGAVDLARLLMWSVIGHTAVELGHTKAPTEPIDTDQLFATHVDLLVDGLARREP